MGLVDLNIHANIHGLQMGEGLRPLPFLRCPGYHAWLHRMGIYSWDLDGGFVSPEPVRNPRLTVRCEYPDTGMAPTEVIFRLSPRYGILTTIQAHARFLRRCTSTSSSR